MVKTSKAQRVTIQRLAQRINMSRKEQALRPLSYKQVRASIQPTFGCDGAVALPYCGMFVCIERDGYAHS
jgi:hypothetical protein